MGIGKDLRALAKEYKQNPSKQYFKHLESILNLGKNSNVSRKETYDYCRQWYHKEKR